MGSPCVYIQKMWFKKWWSKQKGPVLDEALGVIQGTSRGVGYLPSMRHIIK